MPVLDSVCATALWAAMLLFTAANINITTCRKPRLPFAIVVGAVLITNFGAISARSFTCPWSQKGGEDLLCDKFGHTSCILRTNEEMTHAKSTKEAPAPVAAGTLTGIVSLPLLPLPLLPLSLPFFAPFPLFFLGFASPLPLPFLEVRLGLRRADVGFGLAGRGFCLCPAESIARPQLSATSSTVLRHNAKPTASETAPGPRL